MARHKKLTPAVPVPQDDSEARTAIREVGDLEREEKRLEAEMNDKLAAIKQEYGERAGPISAQKAAKIEGLRIFAEANRERLTRGGKVKYWKVTTGMISWRNRPAKVGTRGIPDIIENLKALGLTRFIRVKEELNKDAMLEEKEIASTIKGVTIGSEGEDFIVEPSETDLPEAA